jgi:23S rRNA (uracil1939-C5)-methyltransferase
VRRPRRARRSATPSLALETVTLEIEALGARGDGVARHGGIPVYVPFTVPGDRILARLGEMRGEGRVAAVERVLAAGPGRTAPACRHFGRCGGCALQHLDDALYAEAKLLALRGALARHGLGEAKVAPLLRLPPGTRRRARLTLERRRQAEAPPRIGFAERVSHRIVDLVECPVLAPALTALLPHLRELGAALLPPGAAAHATVQAVDTGIDLLLDLPQAPDLAALERLAGFAEVADLARLSWRAAGMGDIVPLAERRPVVVRFGGIAVDVPAEAFLQATPEAEAALTREVLAVIGEAGRVADLFAGIGTFSFALARTTQVHAVEGAAPALSALQRAARRAGLAARVTAERRDLQVQPLDAQELRRFDAVVFDPPRIGAAPQARELARSAVPRLAAVSCDPASFARDAALIVAGGYRLLRIQPIDQFVWSPHLELIAEFAR